MDMPEDSSFFSSDTFRFVRNFVYPIVVNARVRYNVFMLWPCLHTLHSFVLVFMDFTDYEKFLTAEHPNPIIILIQLNGWFKIYSIS